VARDTGSLAALVVVAGTILATGSVRASALALPFLLATIPTPSTLSFAAGQLAILPTISVEDTVTLAIAQLALLVVLTEPARTRGISHAVGATFVAYVGLVALLAVGFRYSLSVAGGLLCLAVACATYLVHRTTLVRLGLVADEEPGTADDGELYTPADADLAELNRVDDRSSTADRAASESGGDPPG
jgi:hypothetical protein